MAITRVSTQGLTRSGTAIADVPDAPVIGAISDPGTDGYSTVAFTAAATGGAVTTYTATSTPGSITATSATSPITVTGLTLSTAYTFKVKGANSTATGAESSASSAFTPAAHWAPSGAYDSIATASGTGSSGTITFSSIPSTYTHLQIRAIGRNSYPATQFNTRFNSDTGANYAWHTFYGTGAATAASGSASATFIGTYGLAYSSLTAGIMSGYVIDILDYANTNKYKTTRTLGGFDANGSGEQGLFSGLWMSTTAVTSIDLIAASGNWTTDTRFALYGIKGA
jgi:hypothetical protein